MPQSNASTSRQLNVKGLLIAVGLPVVLVGALVATLLGTGAFSRENQGEDASLWLWTTQAGEIARVNGLTAATDVRFELTDAAGNAVQIEQTDTHLLLREILTGKVSAIDLSTLELTGSAETSPGEGVRIALADEGAFIIDQTQGLVNQVHPSTLTAIGDPLQFPPGLTGGAFDTGGRLWIGVPREGTIVQIEPRDTGAETVGTEVVAEPRQELALTVLGDGVAVLNSTVKKMTTIRSDGRRAVADIELAGPAETADTSPGTIAAVTVTDPPSVLTVNDEQSKSFTIGASSSALLGASVEFHQRIYVPDGAAGAVWVYDLDGAELDRIELDSGNGPIELYHAGNTLFANAVNSNQAVVVSSDGNARIAEKDRDDILGGNVPPVEDEAGDDDEGSSGDVGDVGDDTPGDPVEPEAPGRVANLTGVGGDGVVNLSWSAAANNGSRLTKYVIEGAGRTWEIAPSQRVLEVDGLTNGEAYSFTVTAHNAIGSGPAVASSPILPTASLPEAVASVMAVANSDGTVDLSWPAAETFGPAITGYRIESVDSSGGSQALADVSGTSHTFADGELAYGNSYMFTVRTLAGDVAAEPSPQSETVMPFTTAGAPGSLTVSTVKTEAGAVEASWSQPASNGRVVEKYIVTANGRTQEVTGTTVKLSGFGNGTEVSVSVTAVNEAGESEAATGSAVTVAAPTVSVTLRGTSGEEADIRVTHTNGGGEVTCDYEVEHNSSGTGMTYQITKMNPCSISFFKGDEGATYTVTMTIENVAGTDVDSVTFTL